MNIMTLIKKNFCPIFLVFLVQFTFCASPKAKKEVIVFNEKVGSVFVALVASSSSFIDLDSKIERIERPSFVEIKFSKTNIRIRNSIQNFNILDFQGIWKFERLERFNTSGLYLVKLIEKIDSSDFNYTQFSLLGYYVCEDTLSEFQITVVSKDEDIKAWFLNNLEINSCP